MQGITGAVPHGSPSPPGVLVGSAHLQEDFWAGSPGCWCRTGQCCASGVLRELGRSLKCCCVPVDPPVPSFLLHPACTACAHRSSLPGRDSCPRAGGGLSLLPSAHASTGHFEGARLWGSPGIPAAGPSVLMSLLAPVPPACSPACPVGRGTSGSGRPAPGWGSRQAEAACEAGGFPAPSPSWVRNWGWGRGVRACPGQCSSPGSNQEESGAISATSGIAKHRARAQHPPLSPARRRVSSSPQTAPLLCGGQARDAAARRARGAGSLLPASASTAQRSPLLLGVKSQLRFFLSGRFALQTSVPRWGLGAEPWGSPISPGRFFAGTLLQRAPSPAELGNAGCFLA